MTGIQASNHHKSIEFFM
jgi:hypothetical protein